MLKIFTTKSNTSHAPRGGSQEMYIILASAKANKAELTLALEHRRGVTRNPKTGVPVGPKQDM